MKRNKELSGWVVAAAFLAALLFCYESEQVWKEYIAIGVAIIVESIVVVKMIKHLNSQEVNSQEDGKE